MTHAIVTRDSDGRTRTRACSPDTEGAIRVEVLDGFKEPTDGPRFVRIEYQNSQPTRRKKKYTKTWLLGDNYYGGAP